MEDNVVEFPSPPEFKEKKEAEIAAQSQLAIKCIQLDNLVQGIYTAIAKTPEEKAVELLQDIKKAIEHIYNH